MGLDFGEYEVSRSPAICNWSMHLCFFPILFPACFPTDIFHSLIPALFQNRSTRGNWNLAYHLWRCTRRHRSLYLFAFRNYTRRIRNLFDWDSTFRCVSTRTTMPNAWRKKKTLYKTGKRKGKWWWWWWRFQLLERFIIWTFRIFFNGSRSTCIVWIICD